ncbi:hypothetical protein ACFPMF_08320 [Larkinella bovis]|uniref:Secretion system C-terminal sorting domain-containing protein n=1 Tax=Larkinella bovis TaxID=683041 RepID=A0ABW0IAE3_9BACT
MKITTQQIVSTILVSLFLTAATPRVQATDTETGNAAAQSFEVGMYVGISKKLNLAVLVRGTKPVMISLKDSNNRELFRTLRKRSETSHRLRFNFENSVSGVYHIEVSDGQQTVVREVEVVETAPVEAQRYIVYNPSVAR